MTYRAAASGNNALRSTRGRSRSESRGRSLNACWIALRKICADAVCSGVLSTAMDSLQQRERLPVRAEQDVLAIVDRGVAEIDAPCPTTEGRCGLEDRDPPSRGGERDGRRQTRPSAADERNTGPVHPLGSEGKAP